MPRIAALDVGDATVGVAVSDATMLTANPVTVIRRTNSVKADVRETERLLLERGAEEVVVGMPLDAQGNMGPQALKVKDFYDRLSRRMSIPFFTVDERFSTCEAEGYLLETDVSRKKREKVIDAMAAVVILETYLRERSICEKQNP
ncbi:MAG: Holliday junction resolvase RuvX [Abditibacteriota bacterium]|nr:Holliday junction resolvase RuvX [Abditibacteriota bacterium]